MQPCIFKWAAHPFTDVSPQKCSPAAQQCSQGISAGRGPVCTTAATTRRGRMGQNTIRRRYLDFLFPDLVVFLHSSAVFRVPTTHDVLTTLFHPDYPKSHLDLLNLALLASQILLFMLLPRGASQVFFFIYFAFWRGMYDLGLGWVLTKQSKKRWIVREVQKFGWLDGERRPRMRKWIKEQLAGKMGKDYEFDVGHGLFCCFVCCSLFGRRNCPWSIIRGYCSVRQWT